MRIWILTGLLAMGLAGCARMPVAGECPETRDLRCMSRKICSEDKKRGCQLCSCESGWESDPVRQDDRMRGKLPE